MPQCHLYKSYHTLAAPDGGAMQIVAAGPVVTLRAPSYFLRLPMEIYTLFLDHCDIIDLLRFRLVCRLTRLTAEGTLLRLRQRIVSEYLTQADLLLNFLSSVRAIITAQAALALFLRDLTVLTQDLEICVPEGDFVALMRFLHATYVLLPVPVPDILPFNPDYHPPQRMPYLFLIRDATHARRRYVRVVKVGAKNAIVGLHTMDNTAMMCFFNNDIMSCAYPSLTLRRRAILRPESIAFHWQTGVVERQRSLLLVARGFVFDTYPHRLIDPPLRDMPVDDHRGDKRWCTGHFGLCGCNNRFFGDMYCLTAVLHPMLQGREYLMVETTDSGPVLFTWEFPHRGTDCVGVYAFEVPDIETLEDGLRGVHVTAVTFNFAPTFVGAHMLGCRRTAINWDMPDQGPSLSQYICTLDRIWWAAGQGHVGPLG